MTFWGNPGTMNHNATRRGSHWSEDRKHKKEWEGTFLVGLLTERLPKPMGGLDHVKIWVQLQFTDPGRERDPENYRGPFVKPFADTLVAAGYIPNDTADHFTVVSFEISKQKLAVTAAERALGRKSACHVALLYRFAP